MCGVFGFVAKEQGPMNLKILSRVARVTQRRGPHSWGMAWIDSKGRMRMYKQVGKITDGLGLLSMARDATMLIGHCRYATHGSPENNLNNHPHPSDGGWIVHNGVIQNYRNIIDQHDLHPITECDSEVLGMLVEQLEGTRLERCVGAVRIAKASAPLAMLGLWPDSLVAVRANGQPLHIGETSRGYYLASLADGLPGHVAPIADDNAIVFGEDGHNLT